ncbi:MAG: hypothetical protein KDK40_02700, partial [Chlamydiia bacterium]|nr:hypothetical protein [Chlamydiia bacterium]
MDELSRVPPVYQGGSVSLRTSTSDGAKQKKIAPLTFSRAATDSSLPIPQNLPSRSRYARTRIVSETENKSEKNETKKHKGDKGSTEKKTGKTWSLFGKDHRDKESKELGAKSALLRPPGGSTLSKVSTQEQLKRPKPELVQRPRSFSETSPLHNSENNEPIDLKRHPEPPLVPQISPVSSGDADAEEKKRATPRSKQKIVEKLTSIIQQNEEGAPTHVDSPKGIISGELSKMLSEISSPRTDETFTRRLNRLKRRIINGEKLDMEKHNYLLDPIRSQFSKVLLWFRGGENKTIYHEFYVALEHLNDQNTITNFMRVFDMHVGQYPAIRSFVISAIGSSLFRQVQIVNTGMKTIGQMHSRHQFVEPKNYPNKIFDLSPQVVASSIVTRELGVRFKTLTINGADVNVRAITTLGGVCEQLLQQLPEKFADDAMTSYEKNNQTALSQVANGMAEDYLLGEDFRLTPCLHTLCTLGVLPPGEAWIKREFPGFQRPTLKTQYEEHGLSCEVKIESWWKLSVNYIRPFTVSLLSLNVEEDRDIKREVKGWEEWEFRRTTLMKREIEAQDPCWYSVLKGIKFEKL